MTKLLFQTYFTNKVNTTILKTLNYNNKHELRSTMATYIIKNKDNFNNNKNIFNELKEFHQELKINSDYYFENCYCNSCYNHMEPSYDMILFDNKTNITKKYKREIKNIDDIIKFTTIKSWTHFD